MSTIKDHNVSQLKLFGLRAILNTALRRFIALSAIYFLAVIFYVALSWGIGPVGILWSFAKANVLKHLTRPPMPIAFLPTTTNITFTSKTSDELQRLGYEVAPGTYNWHVDFIADSTWSEAYVRLYRKRFSMACKVLAVFIYVGGFSLLYLSNKKIAAEMNQPRHIRGNKLIKPNKLLRDIKTFLGKSREKSSLTIRHGKGAIPIPFSSEIAHILIAGRSRTGKSVFTKALFLQMRNNGAKGVIHDPQGEYVESFYDPRTDLIFNPLDKRGLKWNLMGEIINRPDIDSIAEAWIPVPKNVNQPYFHEAAADILRCLLHCCHINNLHANSEVWKVLRLDRNSLIQILGETPGTEAGVWALKAKEAPSVMSTFMQKVKILEYMASWDGDPFTTRSWLQDDKPGFIFCLGNDSVKETLRPILSLFVDTLGRNFLSLPTDLTRRVYFLLDEFPELQKLPIIDSVLRMGGKKGASTFICTQGIGKLYDTYGRDLAGELLNNLGSSAVFAVEDPTASKYFSEKFGKHQIERLDVMQSQGTGLIAGKDHAQVRTTREEIDLVLSSEIEGLRPLNCYLKLSGFDLTKIEIRYTPYPNINSGFDMRETLSMASIQAEHVIHEDEGTNDRKDEKEKLREQLKKKNGNEEKAQDLNLDEDIRDV